MNTMNNMNTPTTQKNAGLLESVMQKLFTRTAQVLEIEDIGRAFRLLTLGSDALRNVEWTPGDKIQIQLGGWVQRTYTPIDWDATKGCTRILIYLHADGPGTQWARTVRKGDACVVFGPRKSVRLPHPHTPVLLFGDETSLGLAVALSRQPSAPTVQTLLEISTPADVTPVIDLLQLDHVQLCRRLDDEAHFSALETSMAALLQAHATADIVLTGKAGAIQHLSKLLRSREIAAGRRQSKAYWAPGKTGLD